MERQVFGFGFLQEREVGVSVSGATPGVYTNNFFDLIGGSDPVTCGIGTTGCNFDLGNTAFSVTVNGPVAATPEPGTILLPTAGLAGLALTRKLS